jgi:hypothetical protein
MNPRFMLQLLRLPLSLAVCAVLSPNSQAIPLPDNSTTATSSTAFQITNTGTGKAGQFDINNAANGTPALTATSNGTGYGLFSLMTGTGKAGYFQINNAASSNYALGGLSNGTGFSVYGLMTGTGRAGYFEVTNAGNSNAALSGTSNGSGYGLVGFMTGTGRAGYFQITNAANSKAAMEATTNGSGSAVKAIAGTGLAGEFTGNVSATGTVLSGGTLGSTSGALELVVGGNRLYRLENATNFTYGFSPNLIGGWSENGVAPGVAGATIGGGGASGHSNHVNGSFGTIGGGFQNAASFDYATVSGGQENTASGSAATVSGGDRNNASDHYTTVGGGRENTASSESSTVSGGFHNTASGSLSVVSGGEGNDVSGSHSTVSGGYHNTASGHYSFAAGQRARAVYNGSFVWGDLTDDDIYSSAANQVNFRASGGVRLFTNGTLTSGLRLAPGGSQWLAVSDRNMKNHLRTLDPKQVLDKFSKLPITEWSYKAQDPTIRHIGPMAQDFYQAFGLGEDKLRIGTMDADGVMMAAIQGLNAELKTKERQIAALKREKDSQIASLQKNYRETAKKNAELEARLSRLERLLSKPKG